MADQVAAAAHGRPESQAVVTVHLDGEVAQALVALAGESNQSPDAIATYVIRHGLRHELAKYRRV